MRRDLSCDNRNRLGAWPALLRRCQTGQGVFFGSVLICLRWVRRCRGARRCRSTAVTKLGNYPHLNSLDSATAFCRDAIEVKKKGLSMLTHSRSLNWWLKSLLLVTLAAVVSARAEIKQGSAVVFALTGTADYIDDRGLSHPLKAGDVLHPGDTIKTGADSGVDLLLEHGKSTLGLFSGTVLKLYSLSYEAPGS